MRQGAARMTVTALIVAAGSGSRLGGETPKQYRLLAGNAVIAHAVDALSDHPRVTDVVVVIGRDQDALAKAALGDRPVRLVVGGTERSDSVRAGLDAVQSDVVLVHDAARPFCPPAVVDRLLDALGGHEGAVPVLRVSDTVAIGDRSIDQILDRSRLLRVQTPQAFHREDLLYALDETRGRKMTDESSVLIAAGLKVAAVEGSIMLEKITTADDWDRAERAASTLLVSRTGMGFDVHAFAGEGPIILGGVAIEHPRGLAGHSDADVILHALTDALLGAGGFGDIGEHFPPSDPQWKGASSDLFLRHAAGLIRDSGGLIDHVDCTVICEAPKVGPHRAAIRARVADILSIPQDDVSIKATTTERLGFIGRGEGIAAQAVATVRIPSKRG